MISIARTARDIGIAAAAAAAVFMSRLLVIFTPLPILYIAVTRGRKSAVATAILSLIVVIAIGLYVVPSVGAGEQSFLTPSRVMAGSAGYFIFFVAIALALNEGIAREWSLVRWGGTALVAGFSVFALMVIIMGATDPVGAIEGLRGYLVQALTEVAKMKESSGGNGAEFAFIADHTAEIASTIIWLMPSLVFVLALLAVVLNMIVGRRIIRGGHAFAHVHNVARFRLGDWVVWGVIASGALFFADEYVLRLGWLKMVAINGLIGLGALYFFQGLAVAVYFLQGIRAPFVKLLAYVAMVLFIQPVGMALVAIGVADVWANFRMRGWRSRHGRS